MVRTWRLLALVAVLAMVAAACGNDDSGGTTTTGAGGGSDIAGTEISVFAAPTGDEGASIQATFDIWNAETGATATYEGSDSFEEQLRIRVDGGNPPDIAITPQPGSICTFADAGNIVALEDMGFDIDALKAAHSAYFIDLGLCADGKHYAIPTNANFKSIIWYNKPVFDAAGYSIPTTWDELLALSQQILDDGTAEAPWCIGLGSEAATGWPGTDWVEDILVRTAGAEKYSEWTSHALTFDSPEVQTAFETLGEVWFTDGWVLGGVENIASIDFRDAPDPMFNDPPSCLLHRQASFIANFFPEGVVPGTDADFFVFPKIDPDLPDAAMGGGELAMVFNNRPEVVQLLTDYAGVKYQCIQASAAGGPDGGHGVAGIERISANANTPNTCYESDTVKKQAEAVASALAGNGFVFDGSDLMPPAVGQGTFWTGMVDFSREGMGSLTNILQSIDDSWPSS